MVNKHFCPDYFIPVIIQIRISLVYLTNVTLMAGHLNVLISWGTRGRLRANYFTMLFGSLGFYCDLSVSKVRISAQNLTFDLCLSILQT